MEAIASNRTTAPKIQNSVRVALVAVANNTPVLPNVRRPTNHAVSSWARGRLTRMSVNVANARVSAACRRVIGESR